MSERIWVLGAPRPAMAAIEGLLRECGERVVYARAADGERVRPGQQAAVIHIGDATTVYTVECDPPLACGEPEDEPDVGQVCVDGLRYLSARRCAEVSVVRIDHHRPGDPGYGRPPSAFLEASSIGQVIVQLALAHALGCLDWAPCYHLQPYGWQSQAPQSEPHFGYGHTRGRLGWIGSPAKWAVGYPAAHTDAIYIPAEIVLIAAADHCLAAAYRGECPGVDPDALLRWRAGGVTRAWCDACAGRDRGAFRAGALGTPRAYTLGMRRRTGRRSNEERDMANLNNYETGETIREATLEELLRSVEAAAHDGGAGVIEVDGVRCYVEGDRVEGGEPGTEDHDTGRVVEVTGDLVTVVWDASRVTTTQRASALRIA